VLFLAAAMPVFAEPTRFHGLNLDEQSKLMVEQRNGEVLVFLTARSRVAGGPAEQVNSAGAIEKHFRLAVREDLLRVRSEVLQSSPPNNLSNPGLRYRIIIEGMELEPDLTVIHEVTANQARKTLVAEFAKIGARNTTHYRDALHVAAPLVLGVLKTNGRMPAELPVSIERSQVGRIRGLSQGLQIQGLPAGRGLNPLVPTTHVSSDPERPFVFSTEPPTASPKPTTSAVAPSAPQPKAGG
jgi:hypothetical protein